MSAIGIIRLNFQNENINCVNFEIESKHLELHESQNLYAKQSTSDSG